MDIPDPRKPISDEKLLERVRFDAEIIVHGSATLLEQLHVEKVDRRHFELPYDLASAKRYFLSHCLREVQMTAGSYMRLADHLQSKLGRDKDERAGAREVALASLLVEQNLWRRRLAETLAQLIMFSTTNTDPHYFHYLLLVEAIESAREAANYHKDFGAHSATLERRAADLRAQLTSLPVTTPLWYTASAKQLRKADEIVREALSHAVPRERGALAHSYLHGFSEPSGVIHFSTASPRAQPSSNQLVVNLFALVLLSTAITTRVGALAGLSTLVPLNSHNPVSPSVLPAVGDFVVVTLDHESAFLAEVQAVDARPGIVVPIKVRFVGDAPYQDIVDDEFPSSLVQVLLPRAELEQEARTRDLVPEGADIGELCRLAAEAAWRGGIRDQYEAELARMRDEQIKGEPQPPAA